MATTQQSALQKLYVAYFNRPADPGGLAFYDANLTAGRVTMAQISADFAKSSEYQTEYSQATFAGVVDRVYQNLFGRPADAAGKALYVKALTDKTMTVDEMVTWIANGAQGTDKVAYDAKVAVAAAFTDALNTPAEVSGYNLDAQAAAKALLATIKTAAQATTAVAAIDTHVAAVIKAGVEFTLETGLADLAAAQEARAEFLATFGEENDIEDADADDVEDAVDAAELALADQIDNAGFGTASPAVQAAMIDDQKELNADTLAAAQTALKAAQTKVNAVTGLNNAISASTSAAAAVVEAEEAQLDAEIAQQNAFNNFNTRNTAVTTTGTEGAANFKVVVDGTTVAEMKTGALVVADKIDATKYAGLTTLVTAYNAEWDAQADFAAAEDAATLAQLRVELLDPQAANFVEGKFTFSATFTPATAPVRPTYNQIVNELSALTAAVAAGTAGAQGRLDAFEGQIESFITLNNTPLANAVIRAEEGSLAQAKAAIDAIDADDLQDAVDAQAELKAAQDALTLADAEDSIERDAFSAANTGADAIIIADDGTVTDASSGDDLVVFNPAGDLVAVTGATNPGLADYLLAANARVDAEEAVADAALTPAETALLAANTTAVNNYNAALAASTSSDEKVRAAALGTEGAQEAIDDLTDAEEALVAANAAADQLESFDDAITAAEGAFAANEYNAPSMLGLSGFGTTGSDIFVYNGVNSTITSFGRSGDDVLFVGTKYTLNASDDLDDGVDSVLEVFFTQSGNNAVVTIETKAYGSDSGDVQTITLTGVDAADLTFANGIISL